MNSANSNSANSKKNILISGEELQFSDVIVSFFYLNQKIELSITQKTR